MVSALLPTHLAERGWALLYGRTGPALACCHSNSCKSASLIAPVLSRSLFTNNLITTHTFISHSQDPSCRPECNEGRESVMLTNEIVFSLPPLPPSGVSGGGETGSVRQGQRPGWAQEPLPWV